MRQYLDAAIDERCYPFDETTANGSNAANERPPPHH